jgi:hypothetical protein
MTLFEAAFLPPRPQHLDHRPGPRLLPGELESIFDRFYRSGGTSSYAPGTVWG